MRDVHRMGKKKTIYLDIAESNNIRHTSRFLLDRIVIVPTM